MLETMREYARELLEASDEAAATGRGHDGDCLETGKGARARGDVELGMQLASRLWRFWQRRGHGLEGLGWLDEQLAHAEGVTREARARALMAAGNLSRSQGDLTAAAALHETGLELWREL